MKVLLLADGSSVHTTRYQAELKRLGVDVVLASLEEGETVDIGLKNPTGIKAIDYLLAVNAVKKIVQDGKYDIINPHFACGQGFIAALAGASENKPVLLHCLGSDILVSPRKSWLHKWRVSYALKKASQVLVDSDYLGLEAQKIYKRTEFKVIAWGADKKAFDSFDRKNKNGFIWNKPINVIVPRPFNRVYNNQFIIRALSDQIKSKNISITFPNWGDDLDIFKRLVESEDLESGIRYYDFMTRDKYNRFISDFDIYLSASLSDSSPASLIEAMAAGLYPVVGDIPGVREWMDGTNGELFDPRNLESLKSSFENVIDRFSEISDILRQNNLRAKESGMFSKNIEETVTLMQKMIDDASA